MNPLRLLAKRLLELRRQQSLRGSTGAADQPSADQGERQHGPEVLRKVTCENAGRFYGLIT